MDYKRYGDRGLVRDAGGTPVEISTYRSPGWELESSELSPSDYPERLQRLIKKRIRVGKFGGSDYLSWAVFVDDKPVHTGLDKFEADYFKELEVQKLLKGKFKPEDVDVVKKARDEFLKKRAQLERMRQAKRKKR